MIRRNLEYCGYAVSEGIYDLEKPFEYSSFGQRAANAVNKIFTGKKIDKVAAIKSNNNRIIEKMISRFPDNYFDHSLFFVVQFFDRALISMAVKKSRQTVAYQFDSIKRTPELAANISLFDKFYSFDRADAHAYGVDFTTNFYFDFNEHAAYPKKVDFFYIGTFVKERMPVLLKIIQAIKDGGHSFRIMLFSHDKAEVEPYLQYGIEIPERLLTYEEQETMASEARVLIDLKLSVHDGLSFRFFEAMKFRSKVLTTNPTVADYDFYSAKNIFIVKNTSEISGDLVSTWLNEPFDQSKEQLFANYSFTRWLNNLLK